MSTASAIAAVSGVLQKLLLAGFGEPDLPDFFRDVRVTTLPPDRLNTSVNEPNQLNLFLYQVTPNLALRNADLASRDASGESIAAPPLSLDLHYLLLAHGEKDLQCEIILGHAMQVLHETPVLTRGGIRALLGSSGGNGAALSIDEALARSLLSEQKEMIKIAPQTLSTDEAFRLWTAMQGHYRATAAYHVSVVQIESRQKVRPTLPVLQRGSDNRGASATTGGYPPRIDGMELPHGQSAAFADDELVLFGEHFEGLVGVRFTHERLRAPLELPLSALSVTATKIKIDLSSPGLTTKDARGNEIAALWIVGAYNLVVVVARETHRWTSNSWRFALAPRIEDINTVKSPLADGSADAALTVTFSPALLVEQNGAAGPRVAQQAELMLGSLRPSKPEPLPDPPPAVVDKLDFKIMALQPGRYLPRLRVDGVELPVADWTGGTPVFDKSKEVVVP